jgi:hypothetical protein
VIKIQINHGPNLQVVNKQDLDTTCSTHELVFIYYSVKICDWLAGLSMVSCSLTNMFITVQSCKLATGNTRFTKNLLELYSVYFNQSTLTSYLTELPFLHSCTDFTDKNQISYKLIHNKTSSNFKVSHLFCRATFYVQDFCEYEGCLITSIFN